MKYTKVDALDKKMILRIKHQSSIEFCSDLSYVSFVEVLQILPEKYSYYRRFNQDAARVSDCVICMTAIDLTQRANHWMVMQLVLNFSRYNLGFLSNMVKKIHMVIMRQLICR